MYEESVEQLETTVQRYKNIEPINYDELIDFAHHLILSLQELGHWSKAYELHLEGLDMLDHITCMSEDQKLCFRKLKLWHIGLCLMKQSQFKDSISYFKLNLCDSRTHSTCDSKQIIEDLYRGTLHYHLKEYAKAYDYLKKSLSILPKDDCLFKSIVYIQMSLVSSKQRKPKYVRKNLQELMEPKPNYDDLHKGLSNLIVSSDAPLFFDTVSSKRNWKTLPYSSKKNVKKEFRIFKNSTLITNHVRNAFRNAFISVKSISDPKYY